MIEQAFITNSKTTIREAGMVMKEARLYVYTNARRATNTTKPNRCRTDRPAQRDIQHDNSSYPSV